jgi:hypothetical protein
MKASTKAIITSAVATPLVAIVGMLLGNNVCACGDVSYRWSEAGVPVWAAPAESRAKLLEKVPLGSSAAQVNAFLKGLPIRDAYETGRCVQSARAIDCNFVMYEEWFWLRKSGFLVRFTLDDAGRLSDAQITRYRQWFSSPS